MLGPKARTFPLFFILSIARGRRSSFNQRSSQVCSCIRSIVSSPRLLKLFSIYSSMYSGGKQSSRLNSLRLGHRRFFGGILVATYKCLSGPPTDGFPRNSLIIFPRICSLFPSPYAQAVSKKLQPNSIARRSDAVDSPSSDPVHSAKPHIP